MNKFIIVSLLLLLVFGCKEKTLGPLFSDTGVPGNVSDIKVKNIAGGAEISYTIPGDNDLLYVKAVYNIENGTKLETKASIYENSLMVKGFNNIDNKGEYDVAITCVDRSNNESAPVSVKIKPEISPLQKAKNSLSITRTFGGAGYSWENTDKEPITFIFLADTVKRKGAAPGPLVETRVINSASASGSYIERGYPDTPRKFGVILLDNYGNRTDTIKPASIITPLLEIKLDKKPMRVFEYGEDPVDDKWNWWEGQAQALIDDIHNVNSNAVISYQSPYPRFITVDLGRLVKMSRYAMWMRAGGDNSSLLYTYGNPKTWVLYVRSEPIDLSQEIVADNDGDGQPDWTKYWTKVGDFEMTKPSGLPGTQTTQEDIAFAQKGISLDMPFELAPFRYFRLGVTSNFGGYGWVNWREIDFYGIDQK